MPGRVALVTGGSSGIGLAVAKQLLIEGCTVAIVGTNRKKLADARRELAEHGNVWAGQLDVRDDEQIRKGFTSIREEHGPIEVLVNNAGGSTNRDRVEEMANSTFDEVLALNLRSAFLCTKAVIPDMKAAGWGRIVNVSSITGRSHAMSTNSNAAYCAAKAGMIGFTRQCAVELAPYGIAVNAVAPGIIATSRVLEGWSKRSDNDREKMLKNLPAKRLGTSEEAAAAVCYFCSDSAAYSIGSVLDVNGGLYI